MITIDILRSYRIGQYALFDLVLAFGGMYLAAPFLSKLFAKLGISIPQTNWLFLALPIGILVHMLIGSITPMTKNFLDPHGHYFLKLIMLVLVILGLRGIRKQKKIQ